MIKILIFQLNVMLHYLYNFSNKVYKIREIFNLYKFNKFFKIQTKHFKQKITKFKKPNRLLKTHWKFEFIYVLNYIDINGNELVDKLVKSSTIILPS